MIVTFCVFCGQELSADAIICPGCKEYKGVTKGTECKDCGDLVPTGQRCVCQPPVPKVNSSGKCEMCDQEKKHLVCGVCLTCWKERTSWGFLEGSLDCLDVSAKHLWAAREKFTKEDRPGAPDKDGLYKCCNCLERQEEKMMADYDICIDCLPDPSP